LPPVATAFWKASDSSQDYAIRLFAIGDISAFEQAENGFWHTVRFIDHSAINIARSARPDSQSDPAGFYLIPLIEGASP